MTSKLLESPFAIAVAGLFGIAARDRSEGPGEPGKTAREVRGGGSGPEAARCFEVSEYAGELT